MILDSFFIELKLEKQNLYNARSAVRSYLKWVEPKFPKKLTSATDLGNLNIQEIPISAESINAFASNGPRTNRNQAVIIRQLLEAQDRLSSRNRKVPGFIVHQENLKILNGFLESKNLQMKTIAISAGLNACDIKKLYGPWANLTPEISKKIDSFLATKGTTSKFLENSAPQFELPPQERKRVNTGKASIILPEKLEIFIENIRNFYTTPRTSYDGCDTGHAPRLGTVEKLCGDLRSFFVFACYDMPWFYEKYREIYKTEFRAIDRPNLDLDNADFMLLFNTDLMKLFVRFHMPFKVGLETGDPVLFDTGKNTESSPKLIQSIRPLFNKTGYCFLATRSKRIRSELQLSDEAYALWSVQCSNLWADYGSTDKVCRDNAVVSRPRTPKKSADHRENAILNNVLNLAEPTDAIAILHQKIEDFLHDIDSSTRLHREIEEVLFASYFLLALPLRVSNLASLSLVGRRDTLDKQASRAAISWNRLKKQAEIFIDSNLVKNGKRLNAIDRKITPILLDLIESRFGKIENLPPRKLISLTPGKLNRYLNMLSYSLTPDYFPKGLTVHCYRHIVASSVIKSDPAGYIVAAQLLHDDLSQIIKTYGFLRQDEHVDKYYSRDQFKRLFSKRSTFQKKVETGIEPLGDLNASQNTLKSGQNPAATRK